MNYRDFVRMQPGWTIHNGGATAFADAAGSAIQGLVAQIQRKQDLDREDKRYADEKAWRELMRADTQDERAWQHKREQQMMDESEQQRRFDYGYNVANPMAQSPEAWDALVTQPGQLPEASALGTMAQKPSASALFGAPAITAGLGAARMPSLAAAALNPYTKVEGAKQRMLESSLASAKAQQEKDALEIFQAKDSYDLKKTGLGYQNDIWKEESALKRAMAGYYNSGGKSGGSGTGAGNGWGTGAGGKLTPEERAALNHYNTAYPASRRLDIYGRLPESIRAEIPVADVINPLSPTFPKLLQQFPELDTADQEEMTSILADVYRDPLSGRGFGGGTDDNGTPQPKQYRIGVFGGSERVVPEIALPFSIAEEVKALRGAGYNSASLRAKLGRPGGASQGAPQTKIDLAREGKTPQSSVDGAAKVEHPKDEPAKAALGGKTLPTAVKPGVPKFGENYNPKLPDTPAGVPEGHPVWSWLGGSPAVSSERKKASDYDKP